MCALVLLVVCLCSNTSAARRRTSETLDRCVHGWLYYCRRIPSGERQPYHRICTCYIKFALFVGCPSSSSPCPPFLPPPPRLRAASLPCPLFFVVPWPVSQTQGWAVSSIFEEYTHFASPKDRLVDQRVRQKERARLCLFLDSFVCMYI